LAQISSGAAKKDNPKAEAHSKRPGTPVVAVVVAVVLTLELAEVDPVVDADVVTDEDADVDTVVVCDVTSQSMKVPLMN